MKPTEHHKAANVAVRVQELTARNLHLLQAIESTITTLSSDMRLLEALTSAFGEIFDKLQADVPEEAIDPQERASNALNMTEEIAQRMYTKAVNRHKAAQNDPRLTPEDGVAYAYEEYLDALKRLFDTVEELKEWIETHDALLEPTTGKTYASVDDLFAAMGL
jgi:phosphoglycolate phosphatase-like HAD superfamily hydrolase